MDERKKIQINGTYNRYMIKKTTYQVEKNKKRIQSQTWNFDDKYYETYEQLNLLYKRKNKDDEDVYNIIKQQINQKLNCYKQQDIQKKIFDIEHFINFDQVMISLKECGLKCYYCTEKIVILYDKSRESKQWSIDRIDNNKGHNHDNYYIACLGCNLKRRRQNDETFLFTKQLCIKKL
jgi:hypothetical protein